MKEVNVKIRNTKAGLLLMMGNWNTVLFKKPKGNSTKFIADLLVKILRVYKVSFDERELRQSIKDFDKEMFEE